MSIINYIKETRGELKHVVWPNRAEAIGYTIAIILVSILVAVILGGFDFVFNRLIDFIIR